ncbi:hypothetical protein PG985_000247, partial [Apiospora marii]|uniref:uncharacterized protein n=1 Tax=Apiospora marii TaxID=335849 RepID=UPI003131549E
MSEAMKAADQTGLPSPTLNSETNTQDVQESHDKILETEAPSVEDLPSPGEHPDLTTDPKTDQGASSAGTVTPNPELESIREAGRQRTEQVLLAKAALKYAARKLRDVVAVNSSTLEEDIADINQAIGTFAEQRKQRHPALQPPLRTPIPPPPFIQGPPQPRLPGLIELESRRPCEVERLLMEDWRSRGFLSNGGRPQDLSPVIQAFYRNLPSAAPDPDSIVSREDFEEIHTKSHGLEKPQRVRINSPLLFKDLESVCGLQLPSHPYAQVGFTIQVQKLLVNNWRGIHTAISRMRDELKSMEQEYNLDTGTTEPSPPTDEQSQDVSQIRDPDRSVEDMELRTIEGQDEKKGDASKADGVQDGLGVSVSSSSLISDDDESIDDTYLAARAKLSLRLSHLTVLFNFIKTDLGHLVGLRMKIQEGTLETISFEEVYHLYNPGDLIINRKAHVDHLHQVYAVTGGRVRLGRHESAYRQPGQTPDDADDAPDAGVGTWTDVVIDCFRMRWDGTHVGPFRLTHRVRHFVGERTITDLDFFPVRFRENHEHICAALEERGKKVLLCHGHMKYEGLTVAASGQQSPPPPPRFPEYAPALTFESITGVSEGGMEIESDVYVDMKAYHQTLPPPMRAFGKLRRVRPSPREVIESLPGPNLILDYHTGDHDVDEAKSDEFMARCFYLLNPRTPEEIVGRTACLSLLSRSVPVYEFRSREWIWVDITQVEPIDKAEETRIRGWKDLVIDDKYRHLLESLVNNHMSPTEQKRAQSQTGEDLPISQIDLIQGKGRGLIILLHGPPGTGKTSTAEAIAAYTGKPLYAITCGDIGLDAEDVEANLLRHTRLAEKWGCVLLLDEADVFLARRSLSDVDRNALVSVFLRRLEYYSGILFLTTNIVGMIDEAFKSRIHVALRYDTIDERTTGQIWKNLLRRINRDNRASDLKITFDERELLKFAMDDFEEHENDHSTWNARQIRNAFSTAIAMGQFDRLERIRQEEVNPEEAMASGDKSLTTIKLTRRNFIRIAKIADDFEYYMPLRARGRRRDSAHEPAARTAAYDDDDYGSSSGRRRGHPSSSRLSRPAFSGKKSAAKRPSYRDKSDERNSEVDESGHDSDVRSRRMRRSRKTLSGDEAN